MKLDIELSKKLKQSPFTNDRVDDPWEDFPDVEEFNQDAFMSLEYEIKDLESDPNHQSNGVLLLGEAGTGKTHLLMRVVKKLSRENHVMFILRVNNEETVAQFIWNSIIQSLVKPLPGESDQGLCQLDVFLSDVFLKILIEEIIKIGAQSHHEKIAEYLEFLEEIKKDSKKAPQLLKNEQLRGSLQTIIENKLKKDHPEVDLSIVKAFFHFFYLQDINSRREIRLWLEGQLDDREQVKKLGLDLWVPDAIEIPNYLMFKEEKAERAIQTLSILSIYYVKPMILCFDQLEGLKGHKELLQRFIDVVREIFTRCKNFIILTLVFPDLWNELVKITDQSYIDRVGQEKIQLDELKPEIAQKIIESRLTPLLLKNQKPQQDSLYPFEKEDIPKLLYKSDGQSKKAVSIRQFIQRCREAWKWWSLGKLKEDLVYVKEQPITTSSEIPGPPVSNEQTSDSSKEKSKDAQKIILTQGIQDELNSLFDEYFLDVQKTILQTTQNEENLFNNISQIIEALVDYAKAPIEISEIPPSNRVFPINFLLTSKVLPSICLCVLNATGNSFTARMKNLYSALAEKQMDNCIIVRDARGSPFPNTGLGGEFLEKFANRAVVITLTTDDIARIEATYSLIEDARNQDVRIQNLALGAQEIVAWLLQCNALGSSNVFFEIFRLPIGMLLNKKTLITSDSIKEAGSTTILTSTKSQAPTSQSASNVLAPQKGAQPAFMMLGTDNNSTDRMGIIGRIANSNTKIVLSLQDPQAILFFGYMGSGKSYALATIIENALLPEPYSMNKTKPLSVIAFNYRRNPEARIEYPSYAYPNPKEREVTMLDRDYGLKPIGIPRVNFVVFRSELRKRPDEYMDNPIFELCFVPEELDLASWMLLMKGTGKDSEYMQVVKTILSDLDEENHLTLDNIEAEIRSCDQLTSGQIHHALTRIDFAKRYVKAKRDYTWDEVFKAGVLTIFDLRAQMINPDDALTFCLILTQIVRKTAKETNKMIVFDEAHEYMGGKSFLDELEITLTQIRHDGISVILASQFPEDIPQKIFKYFDIRFLFKITNRNSFQYLKSQIPSMGEITALKLSNIPSSKGLCYLVTEAKTNDETLKFTPLIQFRPRITQHGGDTKTGSTPLKSPVPAETSTQTQGLQTEKSCSKTETTQEEVSIVREIPTDLLVDDLYQTWESFPEAMNHYIEQLEVFTQRIMDEIQNQSQNFQTHQKKFMINIRKLQEIIQKLGDHKKVKVSKEDTLGTLQKHYYEVHAYGNQLIKIQEDMNQVIRNCVLEEYKPEKKSKEPREYDELREILSESRRKIDLEENIVNIIDSTRVDGIVRVPGESLPALGILYYSHSTQRRYLSVDSFVDYGKAEQEAIKFNAKVIVQKSDAKSK